MLRVRQLWNRFRGGGGRAPDPGPPSRLVVGLGNPGPNYEATRHNVGFRIVERLADRHALDWEPERALDARLARGLIADRSTALLLPQTFMNRSGRAVLRALERWPGLDPQADLIVVYDDMDLETGRIRLRPGGGAGGHRGIGNIIDELESKHVQRLRFGVGHPGSSEAVLDWVLEPFSPDETILLEAGALERAVDAIEAVVADGITSAMGQFNAA